MKVQFAAISEQEAEVERKLEPLAAEETKLKYELDDFEARRRQHSVNTSPALFYQRTLTPFQDLIEQVVEERVKATSDIEHWKRKHTEEETAINDAEQLANTTEAELVVGAYHSFHALSLNLSTRIGPRPPGKWLRRSSKTLDPRQMSIVNSKVQRLLSRSRRANRVLPWKRSQLSSPGPRRLMRLP